MNSDPDDFLRQQLRRQYRYIRNLALVRLIDLLVALSVLWLVCAEDTGLLVKVVWALLASAALLCAWRAVRVWIGAWRNWHWAL